MSDLCKINPGMVAAGIVEGSVAHVIASTWKYGNCYTNSIEIAKALGLDPAAPSRPAPSPYRFTVNVEPWDAGTGTEYEVYLTRQSMSGIRYFISDHPTEAPARSDAVLVLAALHQATLEGDTP